MYPQPSTMWGASNITEVRQQHVVTFFTYMLKRQSVHLLSFFLHTTVLRCWSLCPLSECFSFLVSSFSCLSFFEMRAVESSRPVLTRKAVSLFRLKLHLFLFLFQPPIWMELYWREWGCSKRKDKKANSQRGALIWLYYWLTECQTMVSHCCCIKPFYTQRSEVFTY